MVNKTCLCSTPVNCSFVRVPFSVGCQYQPVYKVKYSFPFTRNTMHKWYCTSEVLSGKMRCLYVEHDLIILSRLQCNVR